MSENSNTDAIFLFATPILKATVGEYEDLNRRLKKLIYDNEKTSPGIKRSNSGGWHSADDMMNWAPDEARTLIRAAMTACTPYTADIHPAGKREFQFNANMWANINRHGHSNNTHTHPGCLWSCVYYVDDGRDGVSDDVGGELIMEDPRFPMNAMYVPSLVLKGQDGEPQYSQHSIQVKTGMLVIFPSWLRHSVRTYHGSRDRISVAFNLMVSEDS